MFRALISRGSSRVAVAAAGATVASVVYSNATPAAASSESSERDSVYKELVKHSSHGTLGELKAAGKKRRDESNCAFCKWMKSGPCGQVYEDWDDCVHESKEASKQDSSRDFVEVCRPFTLPLMECVQKHPDYYEELAKKSDESEAAKRAELEWEWKNAVSDLAVKRPVFSRERPGEWAGKEGKHVPALTLEAMSGSASIATVSVPHGMAADHWIEWIWARDDQTGTILGVRRLTHQDKPELMFEVPKGVKSITAFESCNLHGVWKSAATSV